MVLLAHDWLECLTCCNVNKAVSKLSAIAQYSGSGPEYKRPEHPYEGLLPCSGTCSVPTYPVYISPASDAGELNPHLLAGVKAAIKDMSPIVSGDGGRVFYTPAADCRTWEKCGEGAVPPTVRKVGSIGCFLVYTDLFNYTGFSDQLPYPNEAARLLVDLYIRGDKGGDLEESMAGMGLYLLDTSASQSGEKGEEDEPFALMLRADCLIAYHVSSNSWSMESDVEPSVLNNVSQLPSPGLMARSFSYVMTGKEVADVVMSVCKSAAPLLDKFFTDNLEEFLKGTRFAILHPMDTVGYFLRYAQACSMKYNRYCATPTKDRFPVYAKNTVSGGYYEFSKEMTLTSADAIPADLVSAGTIGGVFEILYEDKSATYTAAQLGWLAACVLDSAIIEPTKGIIAMRGCMFNVNGIFSGLLKLKTIKALEAVPGTGIADLSTDETRASTFKAVFGVMEPHVREFGYDADAGSCTPIPGHSGKTPVYALCSAGVTTPAFVGKSLIRMADSGFLTACDTELGIQKDLELTRPPEHMSAWYNQREHVHKPPVSMDGFGLYLVTEGGSVFLANKEYGWSTYEGIVLPDSAEVIGSMFGHTLYAVPDMEVALTDAEFTALFVSTLHFFVDFTNYPELYAWLYMADTEGPWHDNPKGEGAVGQFIIMAAGTNTMLVYDAEKDLWSAEAYRGMGEPEGCLGNALFWVSNGFSATPAVVRSMLNSLPALVKTLSTNIPGANIPTIQNPRGCSYFTEKPYMMVLGTDISYTWSQEDSCFAMLPSNMECADEVETVDAQTVACMVLDYICVFLPLLPGTSASGYMADLVGEKNLAPVDVSGSAKFYLWSNPKSYFKYHCVEGWELCMGRPVPIDTNVVDAIGVRYKIANHLPAVNVWWLAQILVNDGLIEELTRQVCEAPIRDTEVEEAIDSYLRTVPGAYDARWAKMSASAAISDPQLVFEYRGQFWGYRNGDWGRYLGDTSVLEKQGPCCNATVYTLPSTCQMHIRVHEAENCFSYALTLFTDPIRDASCRDAAILRYKKGK